MELIRKVKFNTGETYDVGLYDSQVLKLNSLPECSKINENQNIIKFYDSSGKTLYPITSTTSVEKPGVGNLDSIINSQNEKIEELEYSGKILRLEYKEFFKLKQTNSLRENNIYIVTIEGVLNQLYVGYDLIATKDTISQAFPYTFPIIF